MAQFTVKHSLHTPEYSEVAFYIPSGWFGYTLDHPLTPFVEGGHTGTPDGVYPFSIRWSNRVGKMMPHVEGVPGKAGIEVHGGNTIKDSEGCTLLGTHHVGPGAIAGKETDSLVAYMQSTAPTGTPIVQFCRTLWTEYALQALHLCLTLQFQWSRTSLNPRGNQKRSPLFIVKLVGHHNARRLIRGRVQQLRQR